VAELVAAAIANPELAENKCLEVVAETTAPALALEALLEAQAVEVTKEQQEELVAIEAEARQELAAAQRVLAQAEEALDASNDKVRGGGAAAAAVWVATGCGHVRAAVHHQPPCLTRVCCVPLLRLSCHVCMCVSCRWPS
jgi:hypothetical protein